VYRVVVAAEPVTSVDVTSADMLRELSRTLGEHGIALHFAEMKDPVRDKLRRFELMDVIGEDRFHPTVGSAVDAYVGRQETGRTRGAGTSRVGRLKQRATRRDSRTARIQA
jgi:MFS superfamily sulfate permease-like transporter